jgi:hypothetical protein
MDWLAGLCSSDPARSTASKFTVLRTYSLRRSADVPALRFAVHLLRWHPTTMNTFIATKTLSLWANPIFAKQKPIDAQSCDREGHSVQADEEQSDESNSVVK